MILGAGTDPSIDVTDPISDTFYEGVWKATCTRNTTIYQKVLCSLVCFNVPIFHYFVFLFSNKRNTFLFYLQYIVFCDTRFLKRL